MAAQSVDDLDRLIVTAEHLEAGLLAAQQRIVGLLGQLGRLAADLVEVRQSISVALHDAAPTRLDEPATGGIAPAEAHLVDEGPAPLVVPTVQRAEGVRLNVSRSLTVEDVNAMTAEDAAQLASDVSTGVSAVVGAVVRRGRRVPEIAVPLPAAPPVEIPPAVLANTCAREGCAHPKRLHTDEGCIDSCGCFAYAAPPKAER